MDQPQLWKRRHDFRPIYDAQPAAIGLKPEENRCQQHTVGSDRQIQEPPQVNRASQMPQLAENRV